MRSSSISRTCVRWPHLTLQPTTPEVLAGHDVVFLALPHGQSGQYTDALADTPLVIDAGADHRLTSAAAWDAFYGGAFHEPWTYGVPELIVGAGGQKQREHLVGASASPPRVQRLHGGAEPRPRRRGRRHRPVRHRQRAAVGPSGAGKSLKTNLLASEILGTANPYAVGGTHRHIPEIQQALARPARRRRASRSRRCSCRWPHPRHLDGADRDGVTDARSGMPGRARTATRRSCSCCPRAVPRTADVLGANTALLGLAIDRAANRVVVVPPSTTSSRAPPVPPSSR
jgi:N-acetyl-gamma-glutamyl-phosphate reductase